MNRKIIVVMTLILFVVQGLLSFKSPRVSKLKEGDIVFQTTGTRQCHFVMAATRSPWSHCGVLVERKNGFYVLEAASTVKLTPYEQWVKRGKAHFAKMRRRDISKTQHVVAPSGLYYSKLLR